MYFTRKETMAELQALKEWLEEQIDGGEECRGRDTRLTLGIYACERAIEIIESAPVGPLTQE